MKQFLIALDQTLNTLVWSKGEGFGMSDETLSARAYRLSAKHPATWGRFRRTVDGVFATVIRQENHCLEAYRAEHGHEHHPEDYHHV